MEVQYFKGLANVTSLMPAEGSCQQPLPAVVITSHSCAGIFNNRLTVHPFSTALDPPVCVLVIFEYFRPTYQCL